MNVIETKGVDRNYVIQTSSGTELETKVLKNLNICIGEQEFVAIMGRSGSGKTTLLKVLGFIDKPSAGEVVFEGLARKAYAGDELANVRRTKIGYIFQDYYLMDGLSVRENIMLPMILDGKLSSEKMLQTAADMARHFGIDHLLDKGTQEISGGEKQRTAICRSLVNQPDLILADEPTGNLDTAASQLVMDSLLKTNKELNKTVVIVTHDVKVASQCKRVLFLKDGEIHKDILNSNKENFYDLIMDNLKQL